MFRGKVYASRRSAKSNQEQLPSRAAGFRGCSTADCAGKETLEQSPDLQYATASEELPPDIPTTRARGARTRLEESSEEDTEEEDEAGSEDDVFKMLQKARKLGAERDLSSGKDRRGRPTKSRSRHQLLEEKATSSQRKKASTSGLEALLQQNIAAGSNALSPENVNLMVQMELLKARKGKSKKEKLFGAQDEQDDSDCSSLETLSSHGKRGGVSRALREYRRGHREMRRNPKKHIRRYIKEVEHHLGATKDTPYLHKKAELGKAKKSASNPLCCLRSFPNFAAEQTGTGCAGAGAIAEGNPPDLPGSRLMESELAPGSSYDIRIQ